MSWPPRSKATSSPKARTKRPRRRWAPPPSVHLDLPAIPSLGQAGETFGWSEDPQAHLAIYKPSCGALDCAKPAMIWQRCGVCREVFARCNDHVGTSRREVSEARAKHFHWQGGR